MMDRGGGWAGPVGGDDTLAMRSAGAVAYIEAELGDLDATLAALPDWAPARALAAEAGWVRGKIRELADSWDRKLVVAIAGPSGAGKSTLLNALAGRELSRTGLQRPTTREVVAYVGARSDADPLIAALGESAVTVHVAADSRALEQLILVDTPDTNTLPENQRMLAALLERADLVLAMFPAQNPKMQDNLAFLAPYVRSLPAGAVVPVLNMVDRVPEDQLDGIVSDFRGALERNWLLKPEHVYLVSAREAFAASGTRDERPLHGVNEMAMLADFVFSSLNRAGEVVDRRLAHAEHLLALLQAHTAEELSASADARREAREALSGLRSEARLRLGEALQDEAQQGGSFALHATVYGHLAGRWWGPVGWLVAIWAFLLRAGGFLGRVGRVDRPAWAGGDAPSRGEPGLARGAVGESTARLERLYAERWPVVGDALVAARFQASVREGGRWREQLRGLQDALSVRGAEVYAGELARTAGTLSAWPLQVLLNAPIVATIGWIAYDTIVGFYLRRYLPAEYFQHAGITALVVWLASFLLLQAIVGAALRGTLRRRVAAALADSVGGQQLDGLWGQIERLDDLERRMGAVHPAPTWNRHG